MAETSCLLNSRTVSSRTGGSNPPSSAIEPKVWSILETAFTLYTGVLFTNFISFLSNPNLNSSCEEFVLPPFYAKL